MCRGRWGRSPALWAPLTHPNCVARRLVSGAGDIKLTKDGNVLLQEMVSGCWHPPRGGEEPWGESGKQERPRVPVAQGTVSPLPPPPPQFCGM